MTVHVGLRHLRLRKSSLANLATTAQRLEKDLLVKIQTGKPTEKDILQFITNVYGHVPIHVSTPANKIEQYCELADSCVHDTIPICGLMDKEKRTFLDICDMLEYACDHNKIYTHIEDVEGCPKIK